MPNEGGRGAAAPWRRYRSACRRQALVRSRRVGRGMPAGALISVFAFEVSPRQGAPFAGGQVLPSPQIKAALDQVFDRSKVASAPVVTLQVDKSTSTRNHAIRDAALGLAFSPGPH